MSRLRELIDQWEEIGRAQRQLADDKTMPPELRASIIAASNAWMSCADDLKKYQEKQK